MPIEMKCENCGNPFFCYQSEVDKGRKYCGLTCRSAHRFKKELLPLSRTPVNFTCKECRKPFVMMQSYLTAYRKKFDRDPVYCSMQCSTAGRRRDADERNRFVCQNCGKEQDRRRKPGGRIYAQQKYCGHDCKVEAQKKAALARFNEGSLKRHKARNGYWRISVPSLVTGKKSWKFEHRYVMENHLGRELLPEETVHHINGDRGFNELSNLELFSSRHGPGQRVTDKVAFAIEILKLYPEFASAAGYGLHKLTDP